MLSPRSWAVFVVVAALVGASAGAASAAPITSGNAYDYAPRLWLHTDESNWPMTPGVFVNHSKLPWAHDQGCDWYEVDPSPTSTGLGSGAYSHRELYHGVPNCGLPHEATVWKSNDFTSINETVNTNPPKPENGEGFVLQLTDSWREGDGFSGTEDVIVRQKPSEHWIQYWYNFGDSDNVWGTGHEGDWEHIAIRFDNSNTAPVEVEYSYHNFKCTLPWGDVPKSGGRPIVLLAKGSHGSYPLGAVPYSKDGTDANRDKINQGTFWNAQGNLQSLSDYNWYGYEGSWGDRHHELDASHGYDQEQYDFGPSSPGPWRGSPSFSAARCAGF